MNKSRREAINVARDISSVLIQSIKVNFAGAMVIQSQLFGHIKKSELSRIVATTEYVEPYDTLISDLSQARALNAYFRLVKSELPQAK